VNALSYNEAIDRMGFADLKPTQKDVVGSVLHGHDTIAILPTGEGKSACFQVPALMAAGTTLVFSPLIALMKDQVDHLDRRNIPAGYLNSSVPTKKHSGIHRELAEGAYKIFYVAPERLRNEDFVTHLKKTDIDYVVVDEAHAIDMWEMDFRPSYKLIGKCIETCLPSAVIALTATANGQTLRAIENSLKLEDPERYIINPDRPNLHYVSGPVYTFDHLRNFLVAHAGQPTIVYFLTVAGAREAHARFVADGNKAALYVGPMNETDKNVNQERFMEGELDVVFATNAFGMGVDKADIRHVIHADMPITLDAYAQETGRAGRDGKQSRCMLYQASNLWLQQKFVENKNPRFSDIRKVHAFLVEQGLEQELFLTGNDLADGSGVSEYAIRTIKNILRWSGHIETFPTTRKSGRFVLRRVHDATGAQKRLLAVVQANGEKTGEAYEIDLFELAQDMGVKIATVQRHIRDLARGGAIEYEPPFRGSITVVHKSDLNIDVAELDAKRQREYAKLKRMIAFMELGSDAEKHQAIIGYFDWQAEKAGKGRHYPLPARISDVQPQVPVTAGSDESYDDFIAHVSAVLDRPIDSASPAWAPARLKKLRALLGKVRQTLELV